jgi:hypothetical protein
VKQFRVLDAAYSMYENLIDLKLMMRKILIEFPDCPLLGKPEKLGWLAEIFDNGLRIHIVSIIIRSCDSKSEKVHYRIGIPIVSSCGSPFIGPSSCIAFPRSHPPSLNPSARISSNKFQSHGRVLQNKSCMSIFPCGMETGLSLEGAPKGSNAGLASCTGDSALNSCGVISSISFGEAPVVSQVGGELYSVANA